MKNSINLLGYKNNTNITPSDKNKKILRTIAVSLLFLVSSVSVIIFMLIALSSLPQLKKQENLASADLSLAQSDIVKLSLVKERIDSIKSILDSRSHFDNLLASVQNQLPSGVSITAVTINSKGMSVTLSSKSLLLLDNFINNMTSYEASKKDFSSANLASLTMAENNQFSAILKFSNL